eukprot:1973319-Prymnesium_polylepis.3
MALCCAAVGAARRARARRVVHAKLHVCKQRHLLPHDTLLWHCASSTPLRVMRMSERGESRGCFAGSWAACISSAVEHVCDVLLLLLLSSLLLPLLRAAAVVACGVHCPARACGCSMA